jgi:hypothetical protein
MKPKPYEFSVSPTTWNHERYVIRDHAVTVASGICSHAVKDFLHGRFHHLRALGHGPFTLTVEGPVSLAGCFGDDVFVAHHRR